MTKLNSFNDLSPVEDFICVSDAKQPAGCKLIMNKLLKIILVCLIGLDLLTGVILILVSLATIAGGGSVLLPAGILVSLPALLVMFLIIELIFVAVTLVVNRMVKNRERPLE